MLLCIYTVRKGPQPKGQTMTEITVPMQAQNRYASDVDKHLSTEGFAFRVKGGHVANKYAVGFVGPDGECRRVDQGPIVPGPYAYAFGLATVIAAYQVGPRQEVVDLEPGDVLNVNGHRYAIRLDWNRDVKLVQV